VGVKGLGDTLGIPKFGTVLKKTRMIGMSGSKRISTIRLAVLTQHRSVTDRQTDSIALCVASHADVQ